MSATTEPTADSLARVVRHVLDIGYDDSWDWYLSASADGATTVMVSVTAYDADEVQQLPPVSFRVTVEQAS